MLLSRGGSLEPGFYRHTPGTDEYKRLFTGDSLTWSDAYVTADSLIGHSVALSFGQVSSVDRLSIPIDSLLLSPEVEVPVSVTSVDGTPRASVTDLYSGRTVSGSFSTVAMACSPAGRIFAICTDGMLYQVNPDSNQYTVIGPLGITPSADSQGACYDLPSGKIIWAASCERPGIYTVDPGTGSATLAEAFTDGRHATCIFPVSYQAAPAGPVTPTAPTFSTELPGEYNGLLTLIAPALRGDHNPISSPVRMEVALDGVTVSDTTMRAGDRAEIPFTAPQDRHKFTVRASTNGIPSPVNGSSQFIGLDYPHAPKDVVVSTYNDQSLVMWVAGNKGVNGGYINPADIHYRMVRQPGNVVVNDSTRNLFANDDLPSSPRRKYRYEVTSIHRSEFASEPGSSPWFVHGDAYLLPWSLDLSDDDDLAEFNTDGSIEQFPIHIPAVSLDADMVYKFRMQLIPGEEIPTEFMLTGIASGSSTSVRLQNVSGTISPVNDTVEIEFSVPFSANWRLSLDCTTPIERFVLGIMGIDAVGSSGAPEAPILTSTEKRNGTVTFNVVIPNYNLSHHTLTDASAVILRCNGKNAAFTLVPEGSSSVTVTDPNPPASLCRYSITLANEYGEGRPTETVLYPRAVSLPFATDDFSLLPDIDFGSGCMVEVTAEGETYLTGPVAGVHPLAEVIDLPEDGGVSLSSYCQATAPVAPQVSASPDNDAPNRMDLTIKLPTTDINGDPLQAPLSVEIRRGANGMAHGVIYNRQPGATVIWSDAGAPDGFADYSVRCAASTTGYGLATSISAYAGYDTPGNVEELVMYTPDLNNLQATISWESPSAGMHGGTLGNGEIFYDIYRLNIDPATGTSTPELMESLYNSTRYSLPWQYGDSQQIASLGVAARIGSRTGSRSDAATTVGKPLTLPFSETFPGGSPERQLWTMHLENPTEWQFGTDRCWQFDAEGAYAAAGNRPTTLISPTIRTINLQDGTLTFKYRGEGEAATLAIAVECDGALNTLADIAMADGDSQWHTASYDVKELCRSLHCRLVFTATGGVRISDIRMTGTEDFSGVGTISADQKGEGNIYDLQGRKVKNPQPGTPVIENGRVRIPAAAER